MRLLVIGGCGFLGCNFIRYFLGHYHAGFITNVDLEIHPGNHQNLNEVPSTYHERYEFFHADMRSVDSMEEIFSRHRYFAVIHFVSPTSIDGTAALTEIAARHRVKRMVHVESTLGQSLPRIIDHSQSPEIESMVLAGASIYGPNQWALAPIPTRIRHLLEGNSDASDNLNDWLHVDDFCAAVLTVMLSGTPGASYLAGPDQATPDHLLEKWILTAVEQRPHPADDPLPPMHPSLTDSSALRQDVRWHPIIKPHDGIRDVVYWYLYYRARLLP